MQIRRLFIFLGLTFAIVLKSGNINSPAKPGVCFTENKGQVSNQFSQTNTDVLFGGSDGQLTFHLKSNGISYQLSRADSWKKDDSQIIPGNDHKVIEKFTIYRLDVNWVNCNSGSILKKGNALEGYSNYYLPSCPDGAMNVRSYRDITYESIYRGIDLKLYQDKGHLKYDFIVAAGADYKNIQFEFKGAQKLSLNLRGELVIQTPLGQIIEQAPLVTQNGNTLKAAWKIKNNIANFEILNYDKSLPMLIDPGVRQWGTYYGGTDNDLCWASVVDNAGNIYMSGYSSSVGGTNIASVGSHQSAHSGNGMENAMLAKFTPSGTRIWGTYYGGNVRDVGSGCAVDPAGNVFMSGNTISNNLGSIATPGSQQTVAGGNWDAFLVKFNGAGVRQWGTYYGGSGIDFGNSCAADALGNAYLCGKVNATAGTVIATPGSHQPVYFANEDAFLVKFDPNGVRQWGTYYGGEGADVSNFCSTDLSGNIYMVGNTSSTVNIASAGSHQTSFAGGNYDGFLVKFNNSGVRQWATYYGGAGDDRANSFCRDTTTGNLYITGMSNTASGNAIATDGSHQSAFGGGAFDAFLAQFNSTGIRQWGTYYGGSGDDRGNSCAINLIGYVYVVGYTGTGTGTIIASPGSHQTIFGGGVYDAFMAQFNTLGARVWGTYYGGSGFDLGQGCSTDNSNNVYLAGLTDYSVGTVIATVGSEQPAYGGGASDGFFVQFYDCSIPPSPSNNSLPLNQVICTGNSTTLSANGFGAIKWYTVAIGGSSLANSNNFITPVLTTGTYTYYAEANTCTSSIRTPITITVHALPNITIVSSNSLTLCAGQSATLSASGLSSYTWSTGGNNSSIAVTPTVTGIYSLTATDVYGCTNSATFTQSVSICTGLDPLAADNSKTEAFPNPTNSDFILRRVMPQAKISVYNSCGQLVLVKSEEHADPAGKEIKISLSNCAAGVYFVKLQNNDEVKIIKVIRSN